MNNLSLDQLKYGAEVGDLGVDAVRSVCRELLALREAGKEPVATTIFKPVADLFAFKAPGCREWSFTDSADGIQEMVIRGWAVKEYVTLERFQQSYAAPQLPAVPMQPLETDVHGTIRFKQNAIVRKILDHSTANGYGLNEMALDDYSAKDRMQLAQLIGYSLNGYGTLSYVTDESYDRAIAAAPKPE